MKKPSKFEPVNSVFPTQEYVETTIRHPLLEMLINDSNNMQNSN